MYAPEITARKVQRASENQLRHPDETQRFELSYHSQAQIQAAIAALDELWDIDRGTLKRNLTPDERNFVVNERTLCALDGRYYLENYAWIIDWRKRPALFKPNVAQRMMMDIWGDLERQGRAVHIVQLKARRLGVSTLSELELGRRVQFLPYTNAVVASADPTKSVLMADMIDYLWKQMPWWMMPKATKIQNGMPVEFEEINTGLTVQAGNQFNGVGRGATPNVYHLSEIAEWVEAESLIDGALMRAIIDTPDVFGMIEGTGEGRGNWLHRTWELIKKDWPRGRARQMPVFLPWYVGTDIYPSEAEMRARPVPPEWIPTDRVVRHAERARQYVLSNPLLFEHLAHFNKDWQMPREQMFFYEIEWQAAKEKKTLNIFLAEMASDDVDAFQSSNIPVIDQEVLMDYRERTRVPLAVYTIIGETIPENLTVPRRYWLRGPGAPPPITIKVSGLIPTCQLTFQFIPVRFEGYAACDPELKLFVWEMPRDDETYGIGVDTSDGIGQDNSVIQVLRKASPYEPDAQVAEFAAGYIKAFQLWPIAMAISTFYSVLSTKSGSRAQCRVCVECKGNGEACQHEMQKRGWRNFHPWKRYDNKKMKPDGEVVKFGIYTNVWFRPQMMDMLLTCIEEQAIDIPSPWLVQELESLEKDENVAKQKAAYGEHDDRVMAIGFPLFSLHVGDRQQLFARRRVNLLPGGEAPDEVEYAIHTGTHQASSVGFRPVQEIQRDRKGRPMGLLRHHNRTVPRGFR